jgi:hypothetical protein
MVVFGIIDVLVGVKEPLFLKEVGGLPRQLQLVAGLPLSSELGCALVVPGKIG